MNKYPIGRAVTLEQKREVIERIYKAWLLSPHQRLGQLIENCMRIKTGARVFFVEDFDLADACEAFVSAD
jgi:hypothetical protein